MVVLYLKSLLAQRGWGHPVMPCPARTSTILCSGHGTPAGKDGSQKTKQEQRECAKRQAYRQTQTSQ